MVGDSKCCVDVANLSTCDQTFIVRHSSSPTKPPQLQSNGRSLVCSSECDKDIMMNQIKMDKLNMTLEVDDIAKPGSKPISNGIAKGRDPKPTINAKNDLFSIHTQLDCHPSRPSHSNGSPLSFKHSIHRRHSALSDQPTANLGSMHIDSVYGDNNPSLSSPVKNGGTGMGRGIGIGSTSTVPHSSEGSQDHHHCNGLNGDGQSSKTSPTVTYKANDEPLSPPQAVDFSPNGSHSVYPTRPNSNSPQHTMNTVSIQPSNQTEHKMTEEDDQLILERSKRSHRERSRFNVQDHLNGNSITNHGVHDDLHSIHNQLESASTNRLSTTSGGGSSSSSSSSTVSGVTAYAMKQDHLKSQLKGADENREKAISATFKYTQTLMNTINEMKETSDLKIKATKFALKIKKLERQLLDEKKLSEERLSSLDLLNVELTKTNAESERIERENREMKQSLKGLEDVQQKYRLLQMEKFQLENQSKVKQLDADKLKEEMDDLRRKLQNTLDDRDNLSAVSEKMRDEVTEKRATIQRYKEMNKKLTHKLSQYELNGHKAQHHRDRWSHRDDRNMLSDTMYSQPDATVLGEKMNKMEAAFPRMDAMRKLEQKYSEQSRQFMQLKLENQSLKATNNRLKKDSVQFSDKLKQSMKQKNELRDRLQSIEREGSAKTADVESLKKQCDNLRAVLNKKNADIQRLKSALLSLNQFLSNQETPGGDQSLESTTIEEVHSRIQCNDHSLAIDMSPGLVDETKNGDVSSHLIPKSLRNNKDSVESSLDDKMLLNQSLGKSVNLNNATTLSFDHDLDLEVGSTPKTKRISATPRKGGKSKKAGSISGGSRNGSASSSSTDLLDDITAVVVNQKSNQNQKRSRSSLDRPKSKSASLSHSNSRQNLKVKKRDNGKKQSKYGRSSGSNVSRNGKGTRNNLKVGKQGKNGRRQFIPINNGHRSGSGGKNSDSLNSSDSSSRSRRLKMNRDAKRTRRNELEKGLSLKLGDVV